MLYNPYLVIPAAVWLITQLTKFALAAFKGRHDIRYLYASGGMPSVHSAVVCSLAVTAGLVSGFDSPFFGIAAIFAGIVMYDSFGVRRSSGEQARAINMIIESLQENRPPLADPRLHLRELLGHNPEEVTVGAVVGVLLALLFNYNHLASLGRFLVVVPGRLELGLYVGWYVLVVLAAIVARIALVKRRKASRAWRKFVARATILGATTLVLGAIITTMVYERAAFMAWRVWPEVLALLVLIAVVALVQWASRMLPSQLNIEAAQARKDKWLEPERGKKRKKRH